MYQNIKLCTLNIIILCQRSQYSRYERESRWEQIGESEYRQLSEAVLMQMGSKQKVVGEVGSGEGFIKLGK